MAFFLVLASSTNDKKSKKVYISKSYWIRILHKNTTDPTKWNLGRESFQENEMESLMKVM